MNPYSSDFIKIFKELLRKYNLNYKIMSNDSIMIFKNEFSLEFIMWRETVDLLYSYTNSNMNCVTYDIGNYIVIHMNEKDRAGINIPIFNSIYDRNIRALKYFNNVLIRCFNNILKGDKKWLEDYKNSPYFVEPRIVDR